ncbi:MAG: MBL fold metallo-hydrolase [Candidatus Eisenbacteria bacterium]
MKKYSTAILSASAAIALAFAASVTAAQAGTYATPVTSAVLAQGEGDVDESYDLHGADTDEIMETDDAVAPRDSTKKAAQAEMEKLTRGIRWFGQSAFLVQNGKNIYLDPFELPEGVPPADIVLITHEHFDHLSPVDLAKIVKPSTAIVSIAGVADKLPKQGTFKAVKPGDTLTVQGIKIEVVPAYNVSKQSHPKEKGFVGFIVHTGGRSIYHAGDTDLIPEMNNIKADVALLPIGGKFTMDASEAAKAANLIKPKVAIPMHWGKVVGTKADVETFKAQVKVPVMILKTETKQAGPAGKSQ